MPNDHYSVTAMVDFGTKILGTQNATIFLILKPKYQSLEPSVFTWIRIIIRKWFDKGGDLNNAIVYVDKEISAATMESLK
jgi:UDP-3-O-[3-hydroxymyristoyl] N-acetylglucosamine deacetylase/3-hydroxyacyl-[acyl-carrier-protein] dehydratase